MPYLIPPERMIWAVRFSIERLANPGVAIDVIRRGRRRTYNIDFSDGSKAIAFVVYDKGTPKRAYLEIMHGKETYTIPFIHPPGFWNFQTEMPV